LNFDKLRLKRTMFPAPTPEERKQTIASIKWWLFDKFEYEPHLPQMDFHTSDARFRNIIAGTRGGKSRAAGEEAVPYLFAGATQIWIIGQTYALTEKEFRYIYQRMTSPQLRDMCGGSLPLENVTYNEKGGDMYIRTSWGSWVRCISLEKADTGAFGEEVDLIILSESAQIKKPKDKWERILRGRLASRLGDLIIPTTPAGKRPKHDPDDWLFDMYMKGYDPAYPDYFTREWASWENPHFPEDPVELYKEMDYRVFLEQYAGKFVVFTGAVYPDFDERVHVIPPFRVPEHWNRIETIDPGFTGRFVWLSGAKSELGNLFIVDEYSDQEQLFKDRVIEIKNHRCEQYNIPHGMWDTFAGKRKIRTVTYIDPEDPQAIAEFTALGLPGLKANNNINVGVERVASRLKWSSSRPPRVYITNNCVDTIDSLKYHGWGDKLPGSTRKPANDKWKHWADAARYMCMANIPASEPKPEPLPTHKAGQSRFPLDMDAWDRRAAI